MASGANKKAAAAKALREQEYNKSPTHCRQCERPLPYLRRKERFCSRSCNVTAINLARGLRNSKDCPGCGKRIRGDKHFCSQVCQCLLKREATERRFDLGEVSNRPTLKRILVERRGHQCEDCEETTWKGEPIPLEVDHIDGNPSDNTPSNLRLLCPNCHAMTPTAKGKNRGKGRKSRGITLS